jgi:HK97 family phage prohead protease
MTMLRRTVPMQVTTLGDREVEVLMMTGGLKDDGYDLVPEGCQLDAYRINPIVLWQHNAEFPVGNADPETIRVGPEGIRARCTFAPAGISAKADEICGLVKAGVVRACSVGFNVLEREPVNPRDPRAGWRALRWELFENSFVSVPLDPTAGVTARAQREGEMADWKCGAARDLPIQAGDPAWDGPAAEQSIFEWAGGDTFDSVKARQGFLAYDASAPDLRGSYKLPFARVVDGRLEVPKSALRAASGAHGVQGADIGGAKEEAQKVLDAYKEKAGVGETDDGGSRRRARVTRRRPQQRQAPKLRGMYGVAQLAWVIDMLADCQYSAEIERQIEGDDSKVPEMLLANLRAIGETLIAMTEEEVAELTEADTGDVDVILLDDGERQRIDIAKSPGLRRFLIGQALARAATTSTRAGAALSSANAAKLGEAEAHHGRAMEHHAAADAAHQLVGEHHAAMADGAQRCRDAYDAMSESLASDDGYDTDEMRRRCRAMGRALDTVDGNLAAAKDEHAQVGDSHRGMGREVRAASRCVRSVEGYDPDAEDPTQAGEGVTGSSSDGRSQLTDFQKRQAAKRALLEAVA